MSVDALTVERWVGEGIIKCAHIVLSSRIYRCSRTLPPRSRSNWFKLEVEEVDDASPELEKYRHDVSTPLVIQIHLQHSDASNPNAGTESQLLEQWEMHFDGVPPSCQPRMASYDDAPTQVYKRMCVMARTLYSYSRVLPAYRLYRVCREQRAVNFNMTYRILHSLSQDSPPSRHRMERFAFAPIDTTTGCLRMAVQYQSSGLVALHPASQHASIPQHVITDYVRLQGQQREQAAREHTLTSALSASAAPILSSAVTVGGAVSTAGASLLTRAYQNTVAGAHSLVSGQQPAAGGGQQELDILPSTQEALSNSGHTATDVASSLSAQRSRPAAIPIAPRPIPQDPLASHASSAPSDSRLSRHSTSPYTRHLAHQQLRSHPHLPVPAPFPSPVPLPFHPTSVSSTNSTASPMSCSPAFAAAESSHLAIVARSRELDRQPSRSFVMAFDSSGDSGTKFFSPPTVVRSGGRSVGRASDPAPIRFTASSHDASAGPHTQGRMLLEHPKCSQAPQEEEEGQAADFGAVLDSKLRLSLHREDSACGMPAVFDLDSDAAPALRSDVSTLSTSSSTLQQRPQVAPVGSTLHTGRPPPWLEAPHASRARGPRSPISRLARASGGVDMAASAPELPKKGEGSREAEIKALLLALEESVHFSPAAACGLEFNSLEDMRHAAEQMQSKWGMQAPRRAV